MRSLAPVFVIAVYDDFLIQFGAGKTEWPGTNRMLGDFRAAAIGHNSHGGSGKVPQQRGIRFLQVEDHRRIIGGINAGDETVGGRLGTANLALQQRIESPLHVARSQGPTIMKLYSLMQMEDVSQCIGNLPPLRQPRLHIEVLVPGEQVIENQGVNALGLGIHPHARVQIGGAALDDHHQRIRICRMCAGKKRQHDAKAQERSNASHPKYHSGRFARG